MTDTLVVVVGFGQTFREKFLHNLTISFLIPVIVTVQFHSMRKVLHLLWTDCVPQSSPEYLGGVCFCWVHKSRRGKWMCSLSRPRDEQKNETLATGRREKRKEFSPQQSSRRSTFTLICVCACARGCMSLQACE